MPPPLSNSRWHKQHQPSTRWCTGSQVLVNPASSGLGEFGKFCRSVLPAILVQLVMGGDEQRVDRDYSWHRLRGGATRGNPQITNGHNRFHWFGPECRQGEALQRGLTEMGPLASISCLGLTLKILATSKSFFRAFFWEKQA